MPTAHEVATELRLFADGLDAHPSTEVDKPFILLSYYDKGPFLNMAEMLPKPYKKEFSDTRFRLLYDTEGIHITVQVPREKVCTLIAPAIPAKYDCTPLLTPEEAEEL